MTIQEIIQYVKETFIVVGFGIGITKVILSWKTFWGSNDISRRKEALLVLGTWTRSLNKKSSLARKLVERFDDNQCECLNREEQFSISDMYLKTAKLYFEDDGIVSNDGKVLIDEGQSSILRWEIITYLNSLETVLTAWRHNVADREIIEEQFKYLYNEQEQHTALEKFRIKIGRWTYPAIDEFITYMKKEEASKINKGKSKVG